MKLRLITTSFIFLLFLQIQEISGQDNNRPNILLIFCDDLNLMGNGTLYDPLVYAPNIDSLVNESVVFSNAHANMAACGPSRASVFSGVLPSTSGHYGYRMRLNSWLDNPVLSQTISVFAHLKNNGYRVYGSGKIYHKDRIRIEDFDHYSDKAQQGPFSYNQLPHSDLPISFDQFSLSFAPLENIPTYPEYTGWLNRDGSPFFFENNENRGLMGDEITVEYCDSILADYASGQMNEPFFLTAGFQNPHEPFHVPQEFWDLYDPSEFDYSFLQPDTDIPVVTSITNRWNSNGNKGAYDLLIESAPAEDPLFYLRSFIHGYYASVSFVDKQVGAILESLENNGLADNTIVILTSDHGFHLGSKGMVKKTTMWNDATAIPLIVRSPGVAPEIIDTPVSLIDLYPTLLDFANVPSPTSHDLDGKSLINIYGGAQNTAIVYCPSRELLDINEQSKVEHSHQGIVFGKYKYIHWSSGEDELYNLNNDFRETNNVSGKLGFQALRNGMYGLLRQKVGYIRPPLPKYECLFYGDFEQELNGWTPSGPNQLVQISEGDSILPTSHLVLIQPSNTSISNVNIKFTDPGTHSLQFTAYAESETNEIVISLKTDNTTFFNESFTISQEKATYTLDFQIPTQIPDLGSTTLKILPQSGSNVHIDDLFIVNQENASEASLPCEEGLIMETDIPFNSVSINELTNFEDQKNPVCASATTGGANQLWFTLTPETESGVITAMGLSGVNPLIECFSDCGYSSEPIGCINTAGNLETLELSNLIPGQSYYVRVTDASNRAVAITTPQFIKAAYSNFFSTEISINEEVPNQLVFEVNINEKVNHLIENVTLRFSDSSSGIAHEFTQTYSSDMIFNINDFDSFSEIGKFDISAKYRLKDHQLQSPYGEKTKTDYLPPELSRDLSLYPNPLEEGANSLVINLKGEAESGFDSYLVSVYDITGRLILKTLKPANQNQIILSDMNSMSPGLYVVRVVDKKDRASQKALLIQ